MDGHFYDGSGNLQDHIERMRLNIDAMYPQVRKRELRQGQHEFLFDKYFRESSDLFSRATGTIMMHLNVYVEMQELSSDLDELQASYSRDRINDWYSTINIQESNTSKAVRLKIIETKIAKELIYACESEQCKLAIFNQVKTPELCNYLENKDECREKQT
jgi:Lon protease-like protein